MQAQLLFEELMIPVGVTLEMPSVRWHLGLRRTAVDNANDPTLQAKVRGLSAQLAQIKQLAQS